MSVGATGFNEIHRGIPRISRTLLSQRLRTLESRGPLRRESTAHGVPRRYGLTVPGQRLVPAVWWIGQWAARWREPDAAEHDRDGVLLRWRMHQRADDLNLPKMRTVVH